jgi:hypothetical protein
MKAIHWIILVLVAILLVAGTVVLTLVVHDKIQAAKPTATDLPTATATNTSTSTETLTPTLTGTATETPTPTLDATALTATAWSIYSTVAGSQPKYPTATSQVLCSPYPYCLILTDVAKTPMPDIPPIPGVP